MIEKDLIFLDEVFKSQNDVLDKIIHRVDELNYISNKEEFRNKVMEREAMIPTSIGFKIAIPHGRSEVVEKPFIAFMRMKDSFVWNETNGEEVDLIFLIGVPEEGSGNLHLKYLSEISKHLMHEEFRDELRNSQSKEEAFKILDKINEKIKEMEV